MLKSQKGITLTVLVVTIVVLIILASVVMSINRGLNKTADLKEVVANMEIIKSVASDYRAKYMDEATTKDSSGNLQVDTSYFVGEHCDTTNTNTTIVKLLQYSGKTGSVSSYWFELNKDNIGDLTDQIELGDNDLYFVNYETLDVAYCQNIKYNSDYIGIQTKAGYYKYFYDDLKNLKTDEVSN